MQTITMTKSYRPGQNPRPRDWMQTLPVVSVTCPPPADSIHDAELKVATTRRLKRNARRRWTTRTHIDALRHKRRVAVVESRQRKRGMKFGGTCIGAVIFESTSGRGRSQTPPRRRIETRMRRVTSCRKSARKPWLTIAHQTDFSYPVGPDYHIVAGIGRYDIRSLGLDASSRGGVSSAVRIRPDSCRSRHPVGIPFCFVSGWTNPERGRAGESFGFSFLTESFGHHLRKNRFAPNR